MHAAAEALRAREMPGVAVAAAPQKGASREVRAFLKQKTAELDQILQSG
jgi:hypothetical protein